MAAQYTVGEALGNGATVATDTYITAANGTTTETMTDSAGNRTVITVYGTGTPPANAATINANILARQATIQAWITANPAGAVLTGPQTLVLAQMLNGLCNLLLGEFGSTAGT